MCIYIWSNTKHKFPLNLEMLVDLSLFEPLFLFVSLSLWSICSRWSMNVSVLVLAIWPYCVCGRFLYVYLTRRLMWIDNRNRLTYRSGESLALTNRIYFSTKCVSGILVHGFMWQEKIDYRNACQREPGYVEQIDVNNGLYMDARVSLADGDRWPDWFVFFLFVL